MSLRTSNLEDGIHLQQDYTVAVLSSSPVALSARFSRIDDHVPARTTAACCCTNLPSLVGATDNLLLYVVCDVLLCSNSTAN